MQYKGGKKRPIILVVLVVCFLMFTLAAKCVGLCTDYLWFKELGMSVIFFRELFTRLGCGFGFGAAAWFIIYLNIFIAEIISKRSESYLWPAEAETPFLKLLNVASIARLVLLIGSLAAAWFIGTWAATNWEVYLKYQNAVDFGLRDPLFGKDIGFFVFRIPFIRFIYFFSTTVIVFSFIGVLLTYLLMRNIGFDARSFAIAKGSKAHLLILAGLLCLLQVFYFQLKIYALVNTGNSIVSGAGYTAIHVTLPYLKFMRFVCIAGALLIWLNVRRRTWGLLIAGVLVVVLSAFLGKAAMTGVQKFLVAPNEVSKETPYIEWSIANTREAYGLTGIETQHFSPTGDLNVQMLEKNTMTTKNIRLWEQAPLLTTFSQLQEIRTYYEFLDSDNDRYRINGEYRQIILSPRELVPASLPSRIWINEHLTYTHGYGLCLSPVNSITAEGLPDFFIKNIPPSSTISLNVTRPEIYYGESDAGYSIVKTKSKEFDYPSGDDNVYTNYNGSGGVRMNGLLKKVLFAIRFGEMKIFLNSDMTAQSRILYNRNIRQRVTKAIPFLMYDEDPYMVITDDGRLMWIIDAYTTTDRYPYSVSVNGVGNYMRNSVKAVIDAFNGTLSLYVFDETDPVIKTYTRIFPGVFKPASEMPQDLRAHIRYPKTLFSVQAQVYAIYHMTDPQVFYNKEDVWRIPQSYAESKSGPMEPYYTIMKLAGIGKEEEFILMVPFCPAKKENMIAWFAARCDAPNYGKLLVFDFPKQKLVYGPSQIESRINQDPEISKQITLWNQGGSRVIWGSLLVIPIEQSLIYVQPLYMTSEGGGGVPELKRVIVAFENSIAMEPTLEKSLLQIFGASTAAQTAVQVAETAEPAVSAPSAGIRDLISRANRHFEDAQTELKRGNWAGYGQALKEVEKILRQMDEEVK